MPDPRAERVSDLASIRRELSSDIARRVDSLLLRHREPVKAALSRALDDARVEHVRLMRYHLGWEDSTGKGTADAGGKMLRPALCLVCCEAAGGDAERALFAAAAIELTHNFTLIHDDIEDGSETRHGRETLWRIAGMPQAINAGDGMFVLAQRTLLRVAETGLPADRVLEASRALNDACIQLCEGQYADIGFETRDEVTLDEYEAMVRGKTAALIGASAATGAIIAGANAETVGAFERCGQMLGLAFQVQDDVLGIWGEASVTGKPVADDIRSRKKSFPVVWALEHLDGVEREKLRRSYAARDVQGPDVNLVLQLLEKAGAHAAATAAAEEWAARAVEAIGTVDVDRERRADIEALAAFFVQRSA